jgi:hypothetical protein
MFCFDKPEQAMSRSTISKVAASVPPFDANDVFRRLLEAGDDGFLADEVLLQPGNITALLDEALASLKRSNRSLKSQVEAARAFHAKFAAALVDLEASQYETKAMVEDLVNGQ